MFDDRYRGIGTGFTGRSDAWAESFNLFLQNPLFGVGFRVHSMYMTTLSSAHNGYLSTLAEAGVAGFLALMALTVVCCRRLLRAAWTGDDLAVVGTSLVSGYLFVALFERYFINFGNPTSALVWLFLFMPSVRRQVRCGGR
jgi:O-antigen ligase